MLPTTLVSRQGGESLRISLSSSLALRAFPGPSLPRPASDTLQPLGVPSAERHIATLLCHARTCGVPHCPSARPRAPSLPAAQSPDTPQLTRSKGGVRYRSPQQSPGERRGRLEARAGQGGGGAFPGAPAGDGGARKAPCAERAPGPSLEAPSHSSAAQRRLTCRQRAEQGHGREQEPGRAGLPAGGSS